MSVGPRTVRTSVSTETFTELVRTKTQAKPQPRLRKRHAPLLKDTLRKLMLKIHPDRFPHHPEQRAVNEKNLSILNGFLSQISSTHNNLADPNKDITDVYPTRGLQYLDFFIPDTTPRPAVSDRAASDLNVVAKPQLDQSWDAAMPPATPVVPAGLRRVTLCLHTTGGNCKSIMERNFSQFFALCGLEPVFQWGDEYFQVPHIRHATIDESTRRKFTAQQQEEDD